jgi:lysophospholipase L1-like esterase
MKLFALLLAALQWIGTWESAPVFADRSASFDDVTLREVVHTSIGGGLVRVRFTNTFGTQPLTIGSASVALRAGGPHAAAQPQALTFGGLSSVVIPPGAEVLSDSVDVQVRPESDLLISIYLPSSDEAATTHPLALQTNYSAPGNQTEDKNGAAFVTTYKAWYYISGVDVAQTDASGSVVTLGDSITDGWHSKIDENGRWPDVLAQRLSQLPSADQLGVLNAGISGNRLLLDGGKHGIDALARFDRDVLGQSGVKDVIVLIGINDLLQKPQELEAQRLEAGLLQLAAQAHERGLRVLACTILPAQGHPAYSPAVEATRNAVNAFIRSNSAFDGVFDFDAALRDPSDLHRMLPAYDSGDHLHPNTAGLRVMGSLIDLKEL